METCPFFLLLEQSLLSRGRRVTADAIEVLAADTLRNGFILDEAYTQHVDVEDCLVIGFNAPTHAFQHQEVGVARGGIEFVRDFPRSITGRSVPVETISSMPLPSALARTGSTSLRAVTTSRASVTVMSLSEGSSFAPRTTRVPLLMSSRAKGKP